MGPDKNPRSGAAHQVENLVASATVLVSMFVLQTVRLADHDAIGGTPCMGDIYDQFKLELASLARKYAQHPRRQMIRLFLLALLACFLRERGCNDVAIVE